MNWLTLAALWVAYRETELRTGVKSLLSRDWRRSIRLYIRTGKLT